MSLTETKELENQYIMHTYGREDVKFVKGDGCHLYDDTGKEYLDFLAGIAVVSVGHNNERVVKALDEQLHNLWHVSNYFYVEHRAELAKNIAQMLGEHPSGVATSNNGAPSVAADTSTSENAAANNADNNWKLFFCNSGAEANEGAIKLARRWGALHLNNAFGIVVAKKSFHGRTLGTLAATAQDRFQDPFSPLPAGFSHVALNDINALEQALDSEFDGTKPAALLLEPIQGESGIWPCTKEYLQAARKLTQERGILLMVDEVQTGFCRSGNFFAFQKFGIVPDVVTMAKGIANGMPAGAFAACGQAAEVLKPGMHGSTFGGSPLACAAGLATTNIMREEGFCEHVQKAGAYFMQSLESLPFVKEVRGSGLMIGATIEKDIAHTIVSVALKHGFVLNAPKDNILRFLPPLIITENEIDALIKDLPLCYSQAERS